MYRDRYDDEEDDERGTEFTLGAGSLLGIFFGLVLLCGLFFGFGYILGHGRSPLHISNPTAETPMKSSSAQSSSQANVTTTKPGAQRAATTATETANGTTGANSSSTTNGAATPSGAQPGTTGATTASSQTGSQTTSTGAQSSSPTIAQNEQQSFHPDVPLNKSQAAADGQFMVQIATVSTVSDAVTLVRTLRQHGFKAFAIADQKNNTMHVQMGPFNTLAAANQIRARLMADGYNAALKQ